MPALVHGRLDDRVALVMAMAGTFIAIPVVWTIPQATFSGLGIGRPESGTAVDRLEQGTGGLS